MTSRGPFALAALGLAALLQAPAADSDGLPGRPPLGPIERSLRILEIERGIDRAQSELADLISETPAADAEPLRKRPELREIAQRLLALNVELDELRARVTTASALPAPP